MTHNDKAQAIRFGLSALWVADAAAPAKACALLLTLSRAAEITPFGWAASLRARVHQFFGAYGLADGSAAVRRLWAARRCGARARR